MLERKTLSDKTIVLTSLAVSTSDVILNFLVAIITGSTVMMSQSLQGISDGLTAVILLFGVTKSSRADDKRHPFGYGREIFFWVLIAAIFMFIGSGVISFLLGFRQLTEPTPIENTTIALAMLTFGLTTNAYSFTRSVRRLNQTIGTEKWWRRFLHSGMVEAKATFLIDFLGTMTAMFGLVSIIAYALSNNPIFDGIGSMVVGLGMMSGSLLLIRDVKGLIVGRSVSDSVIKKIETSTLDVKGVQSVLDLRTMYLGSSKLLVIVEVHLADHLSTNDIETITDTIKEAISRDVPHAYRVQVEVETPDTQLEGIAG